MLFQTLKQKKSISKEITEVVVDYKYNDIGLQAIIVEYEIDGQFYKKTSNTYSNMPKSICTEVSVKYNTENPSDAIWTNDSINIVLPFVVGIFTIVVNVKKVKKQQSYQVLQ